MRVKDQFRKNELSLEPGGNMVTSVLKNNKRLSYDKIKNVTAYCKYLKNDPNIMEILVDDKVIWKRNQ